MFPPGVRHSAVSNEKTGERGTNEESTRRAADPGTDVGEVEAEGTGKWKMNEHSRRDEWKEV